MAGGHLTSGSVARLLETGSSWLVAEAQVGRPTLAFGPAELVARECAPPSIAVVVEQPATVVPVVPAVRLAGQGIRHVTLAAREEEV